MPVIRDIAIDIEAADILRHEGGLRHPGVTEAADHAARQCRQLASPALVYRFLPVKELSHEQLTVDGNAVDLVDQHGQFPPSGGIKGGVSTRNPSGNTPLASLREGTTPLKSSTLTVDGTALAIGPKVNLLEPAAEVLVGVVTLGPALEETVKGLNADGEMLQAYLLDLAGVTALFQTAREFELRAERRAAEQRWGVGAVLSPGALAGWPLEGQRELCSLVDLASVEVTLSSSGVLLPYKSMSVLIGLGPGYTSRKVQEACFHCSLKKTCRHRLHGHQHR